MNTTSPTQSLYNWRFLLFAFSFFALFCTVAQAQAQSYTLAQAWNALQTQEPSYLGASYKEQAAKARIQQAQSRLKPQILLDASKRFTSRSYETLGGRIHTKTQQDYNADSARVQLTQSLYRKGNRLGIEQAKRNHQQLEQQKLYTLQELSNRLVGTWLALTQARDNIEINQQQLAFRQHLLQTQEAGWKAGLVARPAVQKARAEWRLSQSQVETAQAEFQQRLALLESLVGNLPGNNINLPRLKTKHLQQLDESETLDTWLKKVQTSNHNIQAAKYEVQAAELEQQKKKAERLPTLDLQATYDWGKQGAGSTPSQSGYKNRQAQLGLLFNMPLYTGGAYDAGIEEAVANWQAAQQKLEQVKREAVSQARQSWHSAQSAKQKLLASQAQLEAAQWDIKLAEQGLQNGIKTQDDLVQAKQTHYMAQQEALKARYEHIAAWYRVRSLAQLNQESLITQVHALFE